MRSAVAVSPAASATASRAVKSGVFEPTRSIARSSSDRGARRVAELLSGIRRAQPRVGGDFRLAREAGHAEAFGLRGVARDP